MTCKHKIVRDDIGFKCELCPTFWIPIEKGADEREALSEPSMPSAVPAGTQDDDGERG